MPERRALSLNERLALQAEVQDLQNRLRHESPDDRTAWSQGRIGQMLGCTQQVVNRLLRYGEVGTSIARRMYSALGVTAADLATKHESRIRSQLARMQAEQASLRMRDLTEALGPGAARLSPSPEAESEAALLALAIEILLNYAADLTEPEIRRAAYSVASEGDVSGTPLTLSRLIEQRARDMRAQTDLTRSPRGSPRTFSLEPDAVYPARAEAVLVARMHGRSEDAT